MTSCHTFLTLSAITKIFVREKKCQFLFLKFISRQLHLGNPFSMFYRLSDGLQSNKKITSSSRVVLNLLVVAYPQIKKFDFCVPPSNWSHTPRGVVPQVENRWSSRAEYLQTISSGFHSCHF